MQPPRQLVVDQVIAVIFNRGSTEPKHFATPLLSKVAVGLPVISKK